MSAADPIAQEFLRTLRGVTSTIEALLETAAGDDPALHGWALMVAVKFPVLCQHIFYACLSTR